MCYYIYVTMFRNKSAEVVELVYGTSLENWRAFVAYRGFESHPLRHLFFKENFIENKWRLTQVVEGDSLLNC